MTWLLVALVVAILLAVIAYVLALLQQVATDIHAIRESLPSQPGASQEADHGGEGG